MERGGMKNLKVLVIFVLTFSYSAILLARTVAPVVSSNVTLLTDELVCNGDLYCLDKMRNTCNTRKENISNLFDKAAKEDLSLEREKLTVVASLKKKGDGDLDHTQNIKEISCQIVVESKDPRYLFNQIISDRMFQLDECRQVMEENNDGSHRVLFQRIDQGRLALLKKFCRVYLLELIVK